MRGENGDQMNENKPVQTQAAARDVLYLRLRRHWRQYFAKEKAKAFEKTALRIVQSIH